MFTPLQQQEFAAYEQLPETLYLRMLLKESLEEFFKKKQEEQISPTMSSKLFTISEICEMFKITPATVHNWKKRGWLIGSRLGKNRYFTREEIDRAMRLYQVGNRY